MKTPTLLLAVLLATATLVALAPSVDAGHRGNKCSEHTWTWCADTYFGDSGNLCFFAGMKAPIYDSKQACTFMPCPYQVCSFVVPYDPDVDDEVLP